MQFSVKKRKVNQSQQCIMVILHKEKADEVSNLCSLDVFSVFITEKEKKIIIYCLPISISLDLRMLVLSQVGLVSNLREVMRF